MFGLTVNQLKYLQLKDCVTNSLHNLSFFLISFKQSLRNDCFAISYPFSMGFSACG